MSESCWYQTNMPKLVALPSNRVRNLFYDRDADVARVMPGLRKSRRSQQFGQEESVLSPVGARNAISGSNSEGPVNQRLEILYQAELLYESSSKPCSQNYGRCSGMALCGLPELPRRYPSNVRLRRPTESAKRHHHRSFAGPVAACCPARTGRTAQSLTPPVPEVPTCLRRPHPLLSPSLSNRCSSLWVRPLLRECQP